ncbi:hypothetical protein MRY82_02750 [bacterium]|nr:hypothetical protein [bacterium]
MYDLKTDQSHNEKFADEYFRAAENLKQNSENLSLILRPTLYLYRHSAELYLKECIRINKMPYSDQLYKDWIRCKKPIHERMYYPNKNLKVSRLDYIKELNTHKLLDLWSWLKPILKESEINYPLYIENLLKYVDRIDGDGQAHRFPVKKIEKNRLVSNASKDPDLKLLNKNERYIAMVQATQGFESTNLDVKVLIPVILAKHHKLIVMLRDILQLSRRSS